MKLPLPAPVRQLRLGAVRRTVGLVWLSSVFLAACASEPAAEDLSECRAYLDAVQSCYGPKGVERVHASLIKMKVTSATARNSAKQRCGAEHARITKTCSSK